MATVPVTRTWVAGEVVTSGYMNNNVTAVLGWLLAPALCQVRSAANQSLPNNAFTALTFDTEDVDTTGMHSTVSNTARLTAVYPGWYDVDAIASQASVASATQRAVRFTVNGTTLNGSGASVVGATQIISIPCSPGLVFLNVGDFTTVDMFHNTGGALNTAASGGYQPRFSARWRSN